MLGGWALRRSWSARNLTTDGSGNIRSAGGGMASGMLGAASLDALTVLPGSSRSKDSLHGPTDESEEDNEAEGLALLAHCSPDSGDEDTTLISANTELLDYNSDSASTTGGAVLDRCKMDTDSGGTSCLQNKNVISNDSNISNDAVYHQCRTARISCYKDTLVSVSQDETFGKTVSIQTPLVGSFGDHPNVGGTFHGSRVKKGNACVNQSLSASFDPAN
jgi:hypothetical protein